jgi:hypothetical protein
VNGLNDRDSIADMKPSEAVIMDNWWPYPSYLAVRKGSANHVTGLPATVETLVEYLPITGGSTLFAAAGTAIYNVTTAGAVGAAVQTGLSNARWENAQITTPGGSFLYLVNGVDKPRLWDGTAWTSVDGASTPAITGVTTTLLAHAQLFKNRLFFAEKNSMRLWYLPVNSIGGAASQLDLGSVFRLGGFIQAAYTWTIDAGSGSDDHLVVLSSNGEVAVYSGADPSSATDWRLIGVFTLGRPLGRRCAVKFGGDLAINCMEGVFPLGKGLLSASVDRRVALTDKIQNSVSMAANSYGNNYGWQLCQYPDNNMLVLNVPAGNGVNYQYAQNTITGAWTKFSGWNASVWLNAATGLYYGDSNSVKNAWTGNLDGTAPIQADILPAFSYFGNKARNKYFTMVRPYIQSTGNPSIVYGLNTDFNPSEPQGSLSYSPPSGMVWGSMTWGSMVWGGALTSLTSWQTVGSVCNAASVRLKVQNNGAEVRYTNTDFLYQQGTGVL